MPINEIDFILKYDYVNVGSDTIFYVNSLDYVLFFCIKNVTEAIPKFIATNKYGYVYCGRFMLLLYCISTKMIK